MLLIHMLQPVVDDNSDGPNSLLTHHQYVSNHEYAFEMERNWEHELVLYFNYTLPFLQSIILSISNFYILVCLGFMWFHTRY